MAEVVKRVYAFGKDAAGNNVSEGDASMKAILGGKGANLAEMANIGLPVPPGFTITCQTCMKAPSKPSRNTALTWKTAWVRRSAMQRIPCWYPSAPVLLCPCPA